MIQWCNDNAGFIAALQTLSTVLLSIVAIAVTIYVSRLPYKKGLKIYSGLNYDRAGNYTMDLYLYNSGNAPLYIKGIELLREYPDKTTDDLGLGYLYSLDPGEQSFLAPGVEKGFQIRMENCNANDDKGNTKIRIKVVTEEKTFSESVSWAVG